MARSKKAAAQPLLERMIGKGVPIKTACEAAGVSTTTFHTWCKEDPAFSASLARVRAEHRAAVVEKILAAKDRDDNPDWRALAWYLERTHRRGFAREAEAEATLPEAEKARITPEEARRRLRVVGEED